MEKFTDAYNANDQRAIEIGQVIDEAMMTLADWGIVPVSSKTWVAMCQAAWTAATEAQSPGTTSFDATPTKMKE